MIIKPLDKNGWLDKYIALVPDESLIAGFMRQTEESLNLLSQLSEEKLHFRYDTHKWTIKEIIIHLLDTERIFAFRALAFARGETSELPGYDENIYVENAHANERSIKSLLEEYIVVRTATVALYSNFTEAMLLQRGVANGINMSSSALGWATLGHEIHHIRVIRERYLLN